MADWFNSANQKKVTRTAANQPIATTTAIQVDPIPFSSRRSPVLCRHGCVASSQPLASSIGLDLLKQGANAAEAAIAMAATLCVTEPCSTGLGGDMFCLYYDATSSSSTSSTSTTTNGNVTCVNGSGVSPQGLSQAVLERDCPDGQGGVDGSHFCFSAHSVTVPGAAQGYEDLLRRHGSGKFTLSQLLEPAAVLADEGFPVTPITSHHWRNGMAQIAKWHSCTTAESSSTESSSSISISNSNSNKDGDNEPGLPLSGKNGKEGPLPGEVFRNPDLARVLRELGSKGAQQGFYQAAAGRAIVEAVQRHGGTLTQEDLATQTSTFPQPISAEYRNVKLWQVPPNGQGIAGLIALKGLQHLESTGACPIITPDTIGSADAYHVQMEMMRLGFSDGRHYVADEKHVPVSLDWLLDDTRIATRAQELFDPDKAVIAGKPLPSSCTVSFQVVDQQGNAISFVNSNFMGFGTGLVPDNCGFTLQNRGYGFTTNDPTHPNAVAGGKRPYHTIIPGMLTHADTNELHSTLSNMGGNMQPQGHMQLTVDLIAGGMDPQAAIDLPRFCIADGTQEGTVQLEAGVDPQQVEELRRRGHPLVSDVAGHDRDIFGRAQIICRNRDTGVLWAGSDGRADGCAMGY